MRTLRGVGLALLLVTAAASNVLAAWPNSPFTNLPLCTAAGGQYRPTIVPDGGGGAIIAWYDARGTNSDIYAQHVTASGVADAVWPANGRALCTAINNQDRPRSVSDGIGGAIVTWQDFRSGNYDVYAQHVLASGVADPSWPVDGRALCTAVNSQLAPEIVSDGAGGAIVTWHDGRNSANYDIYAQHLLVSGAADPSWPVDGRALCAATADQKYPAIASDGAGGAIVTWEDFRNGSYDIYAQRVLASGVVGGAWPPDGRALCTLGSDQRNPKIASDGAAGAIVTWEDFRGGNWDIYAHHVLASGMTDGAWPGQGLVLCSAANDQQYPRIVSDDGAPAGGGSGAIVTWDDSRAGTNSDIYAQHVLAWGGVDGAWAPDGRPLCTAANNQNIPEIVSDGAGGAVVSWQDSRNGNNDVYAQHVPASGASDSAWPVNGRALSTATGGQSWAVIASDGAGGAIVAWEDFRIGGAVDIFAQRVARFGYLGSPEAEILSVKDVPNDQGGKVKLSWNTSYLDLAQDSNLAAYDVYRSVPPNFAAAARARDAVRVLREGNLGVRIPGELVAIPASATAYAWEYVETVNANHFASQYSVLAPTAFDSIGGSNPVTAFLVLARNASGSMFWPSRPDSAYSVDNQAPATPMPFTGQYAAGSVSLHWGANEESDLAGYRLYRGTSATFVPEPGNLVAALQGTDYSDTPGAPSWYKLTAVDLHGNESPVASLLPAGTLGVDGGVTPGGLSFAAPSPNPAGAQTTLRYALPHAGTVRLAVYDAAGRLVRELVSGVREPGEYAESWDLRDAGGRAVGAGLYFARFEVEGCTLVRRVAVTR